MKMKKNKTFKNNYARELNDVTRIERDFYIVIIAIYLYTFVHLKIDEIREKYLFIILFAIRTLAFFGPLFHFEIVSQGRTSISQTSNVVSGIIKAKTVRRYHAEIFYFREHARLYDVPV